MIRKVYFSLVLVITILTNSRIFGDASFIYIYPGARATGMAGAFTAISDDAYATYFNDAGLGFQRKINGNFTYANWLPGLLPDMIYTFLGFAIPVPNQTITIGAYLILFHLREICKIDEQGKIEEIIHLYDYSFKLSCSNIIENHAIGIGVKWIRATAQLFYSWVWDKASSWAVDLSYLYTDNRFRIGIVAHNLGPEPKYTNFGETDLLPALVRIGAAYKILEINEHNLLTSGDLTRHWLYETENLTDIFKEI